MRGFLFGAMVGALAAVMVAPRRGEETREMVRAKVDLWQDQMMTKMEEARRDVQTMRHEMLSRLDDLRFQAGRTGEEMKIRTERPIEPEGGRAKAPGT